MDWITKSGTFSSGVDDLHIEGIMSVVYLRDCSATWIWVAMSIPIFLDRGRREFHDLRHL